MVIMVTRTHFAQIQVIGPHNIDPTSKIKLGYKKTLKVTMSA